MSNPNLEPEKQMVSEQTVPNPTDHDLQALIIAIKSGYVDGLRQYLARFKDKICNRLDDQFRQPPLYFATIFVDEVLSLEMVKLLIENGANPNFKDANEQTILFYACRDGKKDIVRYLLEKGCQLNDEDIYGQTAVFYIVSENRLNLLELVSDQMLGHVDRLTQQTPIFYSAKKGHLEMCKALIERGCDAGHLDSQKKTPLQYSKKSRNNQLIDYLSQETKKLKEVKKIKSQSILDSSLNEGSKRKKSSQVKNMYKISMIREDGGVHDLSVKQVQKLVKFSPQLSQYLNDPSTIPLELLENKESWQKAALKILNQCWKIRGGSWFHEPVDVVKLNIPDYKEIIKRPMDLSTVKKRLNFHAYKLIQHFNEQMRLIWKNCYRYNGPQHPISKIARQMENLFEQALRVNGLTK